MSKLMVCSKCHYVGKPARKKRGSKKLEFLGWMVFPFGLPYTLWRMLCKKPVCRECKAELLIPIDSPVGKRLIASFEEEFALPVPKKPVEKPAASAPVYSPPAQTLTPQPVLEKPPSNQSPHKDPDVW